MPDPPPSSTASSNHTTPTQNTPSPNPHALSTRENIATTIIDDATRDPNFLGHPDIANMTNLRWVEDLDGRDVLVHDGDSHATIFWFVGSIGGRSFWLQACGNWSMKLGTNNKGFKHHSMSASIAVPPSDSGLDSLYFKACEAVRAIERRSKEDKKCTVVNGHMLDVDDRIKIRHKIFERVDRNDNLHNGEREYVQYPSRITVMISTIGRVLPLTLKLPETDLLNSYESALKGALVKATVTISRWKVNNSLSFSMEIIELDIIDQPESLLTSPIKRRLEDGPAHSPSKRRVTGKW
ncbi:uncharacterized protein LAESUDRAFT_718628 [Laetiporus sulphureus 93-53]|uniref:Uncharacterized protein n=1 Tax=Laetiporus sulphureus 93-53 TaxID=1314785 RepID=A0A165ARG9_9APHY|nr:uncharacterized protein LAESUDRAFT_718628 [Laetiporus sulphureus 93-53]KZS99519.1 hypothetical protein LAESUDRAFT_718628 [Laetiporus sulphureus 93-53]